MYRLLIVDDDYFFIKGLQSDINQEQFNISEIVSAINIRQAKKIIKNQKIDFILCDIEMPQGTGIELLEWMTNENHNIPLIFLTSHAQFSYAKQAIQLGSVDYLLKPASEEDLEKVIKKAIDQINQSDQLKNLNYYKKLWNLHHPLIIERFWLDIINKSIPNQMNIIEKVALKRNIPFSNKLIFLPILIRIQRWHMDTYNSSSDQKTIEYGVRKLAEEVFFDGDNKGNYIQLKDELSLIIVTMDARESYYRPILEEKGKKFINLCNMWFRCDLTCYFGEQIAFVDMYDQVENLKVLEINNVTYDNTLLFLKDAMKTNRDIQLPDMKTWVNMLKNSAFTQVSLEIETYLKEAKDVNVYFLRNFQQNLLQMIYLVLNYKGIQAYQLFGAKESIELSNKAVHSIKDMIIWIRHVINKAAYQTSRVKETNTIVETVLCYIDQNIDKPDLSRSEIAEQVFLNEDYLSRLFKKELGIPLSNYIMDQRIKLARELLLKTDISISNIAFSVGYSNFSHFSKVFKDKTSYNPSEFRKKMLC
ncbi:transcriptional regulator [Gracilibacillus boraciitolerans JCM 21714]|uniref:Transcriptional regulator n=1 Tax=Gracilibacillus boraciitolerans JCM 21714 TaxID=1298598 RepID=W4VK19_9BACI|nr:response regulator [Gracilibacillus boraciitolerans]GAE93114.1 transcriptional regulator [Gracilibacillus boraciitolerans JCM 21714]